MLPCGSEINTKARAFQTRESAQSSDSDFAEGSTDEVTAALNNGSTI